MHSKAVIFDLDNTLYDEGTYVYSGFAEVASHLARRYGADATYMLDRMIRILHEEGRGRVFDLVLHEIAAYNDAAVRSLVLLYRSHHPTLNLYDDVAPVLTALRERGVKLALLTDGHALVQARKVAALGLEEIMDAIVYTDSLGPSYCKPSPVPYCVALEMVGVRPEKALYVGDDISKDFMAPNALGMRTIRRRGDGLIGVSKRYAPTDDHLPGFDCDDLRNVLDLL